MTSKTTQKTIIWLTIANGVASLFTTMRGWFKRKAKS